MRGPRSSTETVRAVSGAELLIRHVEPERARALIVLSHGLGEHSGRYLELAERLSGRGFACLAYDHRGHGRSSGRRGDIGHFEQYADDLGEMVARGASSHPNLPIFLFGHSMGAVIALMLVLRKPAEVVPRGLILSAPALVPSVRVGLHKRLILRALRGLWPTLSLPTGIDPESLSSDPAVVAGHRSDPYVHGVVSLRWYTEFQRACQDCLSRAAQLEIPLYLFHGTADAIASPEGSRSLMDRAASADKQARFWPGLRHETWNELEPDRTQVLDSVGDWLEQRTGPIDRS